MTTKIQQLKEIVKQIAVLQRTIKNHVKTVNFKGDKRETVEFFVYDQILDQKTRKWVWVTKKAKIYLTPYNAQMLLTQPYGWTPTDQNSTVLNMDGTKASSAHIYQLNLIDMGSDNRFSNMNTLARVFNEAYALLKYERKTKKNEELEKLRKEVDECPTCYVKQIMDYFRDEKQEEE